MKLINKFLKILFFIIFFLLFDCANKPIVQISYKLELKTIETTFFSGVKDISKLFYYYDDFDDKEYLISYSDKDKEFIIFDYIKGNVVNSFHIEFQINSLYIKNLDSIYVSFDDAFGDKANIFGIINSKGKIMERFNYYNTMIMPEIDTINRVELSGDNKVIKLANNPYSFNNFYVFDESIYMNIVPNKVSNVYDYPTLAFIKMDNNHILKYDYKYPKFYKENNYKADYIDFIIKKDKKNITNIIISYTLTDSIYIIRLVPRFEANDIALIDDPDYDTLIIKKVNSDYKKEIYYRNKNHKEDAATYFGFKYAYIKYDPFRNYFYRIAIHTLKDDDNTIKFPKKNSDEFALFTQKRQDWSIIVADGNMNMKCEKIIPASDNYLPNILVTKEGLGFINIDDVKEKNGVNIIKTAIRVVRS